MHIYIMYNMHIRIYAYIHDDYLLFLSGSFFLAYYAQYFARIRNILPEFVTFCSKLSYIASYLTVTSHTYIPKLFVNIIDSYG